jgi:hypothetical protein
MVGGVETRTERVPIPVGEAKPDVVNGAATGDRRMLHFRHFDKLNHRPAAPVPEHGPLAALPHRIVFHGAEGEPEQVHVELRGGV